MSRDIISPAQVQLFLPEAFAAAWDGTHAPQQAHGFFSRVRSPKTEILRNYTFLFLDVNKAKIDK